MTNDGLIPDVSRKKPLRIVFREDNSADVELCIHELKQAKIEVRCEIVRTEANLVGKLQGARFDIVLSNYHLVGQLGRIGLR